MKFTPKSENELAQEALIPDGVYPFEILNASDTQSKTSGADMIAVQLRVFAGEGREPVIKDYLLESFLRKIFNFAKITGLSAQYHAGSLCAEDCLGKTGYVKIGTEKAREKKDASGRPTGDFYPPKNTVKDYVSPPQRTSSLSKPQPIDAQLANVTAGADQDVPF